jgi:hypothetical protein
MNQIERRIILNWGERLVLLGLLIYFVFFLIHVSVCLVFPNDLDNEEGFILNQVHQLRTGHTIYPTLADYPYTVGNYPPVFQLMCVPFNWVFGDTHFFGRFISILSTLLLGGLIFLIVKRFSEDWFAGAVAGLFPFAVHYVYLWAPYDRVDMLALFFTVLGLYLLLRNPQRITYPIVFFLLALFTKQTMIAAPAAALIYLWGKDKKDAGLFLVITAIAFFAIFFALNFLTHGQFYKHLVVYNVNPFHWSDVRNFFFNLFRFYWIFLGFIFVSLFITVTDSEKRLFLFYFLFAVLVSLSCGKEGSAVNYLIELIVAGSILMGMSLAVLNKNILYARIFIPIILLIQLYLIIHVVYMPQYWYGTPQYRTTPSARNFDLVESVERIIRETPGDVLSDDASLLVRTGKPVLFQPFIMSTLARQGKWNQSKFINDIRQKRFSLLVLYFPLRPETPDMEERYTPEMINALMENYEPVDYRHPYWIHRPKFSSH